MSHAPLSHMVVGVVVERPLGQGDAVGHGGEHHADPCADADLRHPRVVRTPPDRPQQLGRHAPVRALGAVFIDDIEKGKLAFGIGPGFLGHAGLWSIRAPLSKKIAARKSGGRALM